MRPRLVDTAQRVIDEKTALPIDRVTGLTVEKEFDKDGMKAAILLDMQTAAIIVDSYHQLEDKSKFDAALTRVGALRLIHRLWDIYSS